MKGDSSAWEFTDHRDGYIIKPIWVKQKTVSKISTLHSIIQIHSNVAIWTKKRTNEIENEKALQMQKTKTFVPYSWKWKITPNLKETILGNISFSTEP